MDTQKRPIDRKTMLSTLWIFASLNYIYADVVTLFDKTIMANISQTALLGFALLLEAAFAMVLLSRLLPYRLNRYANIIVAVINTGAVVASVAVQSPAAYYAVFAAVEIVTGIVIVWYAWTWP